MLFTRNLEELIFDNSYNNSSDKLVILSGYLGPNPVARLADLPLKSTVIYGMYGDRGIQQRLHNALINIQRDIPYINIYYSTVPIHSKCYMWENEDRIDYALIGSANFSINGLTTPYRETLMDVPESNFNSLENYIDIIMKNSRLCTDIDVRFEQNQRRNQSLYRVTNICNMSLLDRSGNVPNASGLNWGHGIGNVTPNDAYIPIRKEHLRTCPNLFPPKQEFPNLRQGGRLQRHNDSIEIIWDDGFVMEGLLEGNQLENGLIYPKQIASAFRKSIMGEYLRGRLGLYTGQFITVDDLRRYGRTDITVSLLDDGIYSFDFSV